MIRVFLDTFAKNYAAERNRTLITLAAHAGVFLGLWLFLIALEFGFLSLLFAAALVVGVSWYLPPMAWFWGRELTLQEPEPAPKPEAVLPKAVRAVPDKYARLNPDFLMVPRATPKGTEIYHLSQDRAELRVKSVVRFWGWFAPLLWVALACLGIPVGGFIGFTIVSNSYRATYFDIYAYPFWGAIIVAGGCLVGAVISYFHFRPWVKAEITPSVIRYGSQYFDRKHFDGMLIGYKSNEADLRSSVIDAKFGVRLIRLGYGPWGEDLNYMVDEYHAAEIVNWMNGIIDSIGAPPPKRYDPYAGSKIELL